MMTKCVSVRLDSLVSISDKAYKAVDFAGNEAIIPKSQVLARDYDVVKSDAWWISAWIMQRRTCNGRQRRRPGSTRRATCRGLLSGITSPKRNHL